MPRPKKKARKIRITVEHVVEENGEWIVDINHNVKQPMYFDCMNLKDCGGYVHIYAYNSGHFQHVWTEQEIKERLYIKN